ncbi:MAG: hypothetical protein K1X89_06900 [Myxococcaceae bacterium]|nr:hypothetical protein [Myxococcaceae bacterium]
MRIKGSPPPPPPATSSPAAEAMAAGPVGLSKESESGWSVARHALGAAVLDVAARVGQASGVPQLLSRVKDRLEAPSEREQALVHLAKQVDSLTVPQRAQLLTALESADAGKAGAAAAQQVLLATHGRDLTALKNQVDAGADLQTLEKLVFEVLSPEQRSSVLAHFAREAVPTGEVKLLSDIDDTIYASVNDPRFRKGTEYPGVRAFYRALDQGPRGAPEGDLVFLTARPEREASPTFAQLSKLGFAGSSVMTGGLATYLRRMLVPFDRERWAYGGMGAQKVKNFERHQALFPEYRYAFVGDNGQGDVLAGRGMAATRPDRIAGVFIHQVAPRTDAQDDGITYFQTYVGAARAALAQGLISPQGAATVAQDVLGSLDSLAFGSPEAEAGFRAQVAADVQALDAQLSATASPSARP